ncbi:galactose mutarotase [Oricola cellulosilytica]|uniref:Aldose 1-epimerase n=2 Tax=Oricola cellulosilytica TaxID=1429082 RepID=A0A4R0PFV6_9HYPH|nr:galactose mutarotase [Oricola cellulosilytica]
MASGMPVERIRIRAGGLTAHILTLGAIVQDLRLEGHEDPLVLGFETLENYARHSPYFGAIVGRFANRIANGRFKLDGQTHELSRNNGGHCLHGGVDGFSSRIWEIEDCGPSHVELALDSLDGDMGFPGALRARCRYELSAGGALGVALSAVTDAPTVCSMAHHSYFNLEDGGARAATDHEVMISADRYLPVDDALIPLGNPAPVEGTAFDFRTSKRLNARDPAASYDHNFCIGAAAGSERLVARLRAPRSGVAMEVITAEPGLQFFTSPELNIPVPGLGGRRYGHHAGVCLETQIWPDSPNRPEYPGAVLRPGDIREQRTVYRFSRHQRA